ncbi:hypothetical protein MINTM005_12940 [Mycobacterium intracellulare]|uniref:hypothetical protein n=1 Tax=Mycobacterium intracellulare TaxID=1767 RepID=UPI001925E747|nr:hypothetical protein [Mycobacterium intracellulare]BCO56050.1 hypothetical protein MINTM005_12940 [Mycobacterium intracellulare]
MTPHIGIIVDDGEINFAIMDSRESLIDWMIGAYDVDDYNGGDIEDLNYEQKWDRVRDLYDAIIEPLDADYLKEILR